MKKLTALLLAVLMLLSLAACAGSDPAAGTYKGVHAKFVGDSEWYADEPEFSLELKNGGKGVFHRDDYDFDVTWKLDGETFTMQETFLGITNDYTGTLVDGELHIFNGDPTDDLTYEYVFTK